MGIIPKVRFNIIDKTYIAPPVEGSVHVYIPFFSEKGIDGKIFKLYSPEQVVSLFGQPNLFKYGNGLYYILKALEYDDVIVWGIRLTPPDAKYAAVKLVAEPISTQTTVSEDALNTTDIRVDNVLGFEVGKTVAIYDSSEPINTIVYADIVSIDAENNILSLSAPVTASSGWEVTQIPEINLQYVDGISIDDIEKFNVDNTQPELYILARGKGSYYNYVTLYFEPNTTLEKYYVDESSYKPYYRGIFYNVTVVEQKLGGSPKILENNYAISFAEQTPAGEPVINPVSGVNIFIDDVFENNSYHILVKSSAAFVESIQNLPHIYGKALQKFFASNQKIRLKGGFDGTLDFNTQKSLLIQAYNGTYNEETAKMLISDYPFKPYEVEYVVDYTGDIDVQNAVSNFAKSREDCIAIVSAPRSGNYQNDKNWRINSLNASNFYLGLYPGMYGKAYDPYSKRDIELPQSFWALDNHLYIDTVLDLTEPAAGINGGALRSSVKSLSYEITSPEIAEELADIQINPLVKTPDGKYFYLTQLTAYKRPTYLQRLNYVKFLNKLRKDLYPRLYDLLQRKATDEVIEEANRRVREYLSNFTVDKPRMNILESYEVNVEFDKSTFTLYVNIILKFVGIIEEINVNLILRQ